MGNLVKITQGEIEIEMGDGKLDVRCPIRLIEVNRNGSIIVRMPDGAESTVFEGEILNVHVGVELFR